MGSKRIRSADIVIMVTPEQREIINQTARAKGTTVNWVVRNFLEQWIAENKDATNKPKPEIVLN